MTNELTFDEALAELRVDAETLRRMISDGAIRAVQREGVVSVAREEVERVKAGRVSSSAPTVYNSPPPLADETSSTDAREGHPAEAEAPAQRDDAKAGRPRSQAEHLERGTRIGGYRIEGRLGEGGMGVVYRATQLSLGRIVALKVLPTRSTRDADFVARFEREAQTLASLSHPRIVAIIDRGLENGVAYFVMEYIEGESLRVWIDKGRTPQQQVVPLALQVCEGLMHAHGKGVIHRDIKPENLLVDHSGNIRIADFGLARIVRGSRDNVRRNTLSGMTLGTPFYMAPEQVGGSADADERADLYAVGVVLYELLTGSLPVGRFRSPIRRVKEVDRRLDRLVMHLLEPEPGNRPSSARDVAETLTKVWKSFPESSPEVVPEVRPIEEEEIPEVEPLDEG